MDRETTLPKIAVFSGATATISNSPPLITSNRTRARYGLPLLMGADDRPLAVDTLRLERIAAPVTVYVEAFSAHPLEVDAADLCAPPDGWVDGEGSFSTEEPAAGGTPVYVIELATKARILLMACLLKLGALPPASDPRHPTSSEMERTKQALGAYQEIFDTH